MWLYLLTLLLFLLLCLTILFALIYFGLFEELEVKVGSPPYPFGGHLIAYKKEKSCYSDSSAIFTEVCSLVPTLHTFGIYLDEPNDQNRYNCRYLVGVILKPQSEDFESQKQLLESKGFSLGQLPDVDHVVSTVFPFKGIISVVIAIRRVYPRIRSYIVEHNLCAHPAVELYDEKSIYFMFPLAKQNQFYQLYGTDDNEEESDDTEDDDEPEREEEVEEEKVIDGTDNEETGAESSLKYRLRGSKKKSSNSSTSSSFEELLVDECPKYT